ncbi:hypothetical protein IQ260_16920 [Leptolyngbya cf. ectocarpi LEGE 11479]|uniref:Uncharacterized protein n=1 Tax=Leptolyngbya cf. ectocarpi LEGE 11479 TaxID=1828722 RepID=A0A928ZVQ5_LEPEC|nr:hypothetical protein [Leptolyngbya ectocarpi]MBE9068336.1 hypothetical protein [Leptolyngbya cf. ectocarpi LEGE 11479]
MFLDELTPIVQEILGQPVAFLSGFASGLLKLDLSDDPVKSWLENQGADVSSQSDDDDAGKGPQKISID